MAPTEIAIKLADLFKSGWRHCVSLGFGSLRNVASDFHCLGGPQHCGSQGLSSLGTRYLNVMAGNEHPENVCLCLLNLFYFLL